MDEDVEEMDAGELDLDGIEKELKNKSQGSNPMEKVVEILQLRRIF